ncbi:MAG TPA: oxidoreductase [Acidimicrobiales bacterium]
MGPFSVSPLGLGAMRLAGPNAFGPPRDRREALAVLREAVRAGVNHIDTAQFYGPDIVNELIREALYPYPEDLVLVTKVGARRDRHGGFLADDDPRDLRRSIEDNLRKLGVDALGVVNLQVMRRGEPNLFFDDQLDAMVSARDDGLVKSIGLSNVTLPQLLHALQFTDLACVQNAFHLGNRRSQPQLNECARRHIAFVPSAPLGSGGSDPRSVLGRPEVLREAARLSITAAQVVLAWTLRISPNVLLIPGTSSLSHLVENVAVSEVHLDWEAIRRLSLI